MLNKQNENGARLSVQEAIEGFDNLHMEFDGEAQKYDDLNPYVKRPSYGSPIRQVQQLAQSPELR